MRYRSEMTSQISFPLGGIGAGCIGLAGNGGLIDWEIFNRPNKGGVNGMSHFAVKAERDGQVLDARILNGDLPPPYTGNYQDVTHTTYNGFGWGPSRATLCGLPHFSRHSFDGEYPLARLEFSDPSFPGRAELLAWSPLIPGDDHDSSLPAACFEITLTNDTPEPIDYTVVGTLSNPFVTPTAFNRFADNQLTFLSGGDLQALDYGELALSVDAPELSFQEYWYHGGWCDDLEVYWNDLTRPGKFQNRRYEPGATQRNTGSLASHFHLAAGESRTVRFVITWHVPNRTNDWNKDADQMAAANGLVNRWRNWYATQWESAAASGRYLLDAYDRVRLETMRFHDLLFASTLPAAALDGISANISTLKSPTCLRLEDGTFYGWEGVACHSGSCEGSCAHVWNYAQALPFLFPALERSMRAAHYRHSVDADGGCHFRLMLPLGIKATPDFQRPCVDGQYGDVMKAWRDWKISGDTAWLRQQWPAVRKSIEYAWSDRNYDRWDPEKTGVITGRQHHTLDVEMFGPSAWLNGHYLGALKAAAEMADLMGEPTFAVECRELFARGKAWTDANLFNGEYYIQQIDLSDCELLTRFRRGDDWAEKTYWDEEHKQIKYQLGSGCEIDMHLPQWYASLYGLGEVLDPAKTRMTLEAIFKHNFKSARQFVNTWRNYCVNDEAGVQMCSWPDPQGKPVIPVPYGSETMHGFEWAFACHLIMVGMLEEGMAVVQAIRARYDGRKRNPWNELECGSNYARSMASYAVLHAFSGFSFDLTKGFIGFAPVVDGDFRCFWSLGTAWGDFLREGDKAEIRVAHGALTLEMVGFSVMPKHVESQGNPFEFHLDGDKRIVLTNRVSLKAGESIVAKF